MYNYNDSFPKHSKMPNVSQQIVMFWLTETF